MLNENECLKKTCKAGYPQYFAVVLDPVTGEEIASRALTSSEYINEGGAGGISCPASGNRTLITPRKPPMIGTGYLAQIAKQGKQLGLDQKTIKLAQDVIAPMRYYYITMLRNKGVHVIDPNNLYEIISKYSKANPNITSPSNDLMIAMFQPSKAQFKATYQVRTSGGAQYNPKSGEGAGGGGGSVDIGGLLGGIVGMIGSIAGSINSSNVDSTLSTWVSNYANYMQTDFAAINSTLQSAGPSKALEHFYAYKNGSWKGLDNDVNTLCANNHKEVPGTILDLRIKQDQLETKLKGLVNGGAVIPSPPNNNSNNSSIDPVNNGNTPTNNDGWFVRNWYYVVGGFVLLILGIVVVSKMAKSK